MTAQELVDVMAKFYKGRPDAETISIEHWQSYMPVDQLPRSANELPTFSADMSVTVGELRAMATPVPAPVFENARRIQKLSEELTMVTKPRTVRVRPSSYDRWTQDADNKIRQDYRTLGAAGVREHHLPDRSEKAIKARAHKIGAQGHIGPRMGCRRSKPTAPGGFSIAKWDIGLGPGFIPFKYKLDGVPVDSVSVVQQKRGGGFEAVILDVNERKWISEEFATLTEARRALCAKLGVVIETWVHPAF